MILGKIGNQLSAGSWPSVLLELLVVIVGVYGAFQLENWGEGLRESKREKMLLEQLHGEIQRAYPLMEEQVEGKRHNAEVAMQVAALLMQAAGTGELDTEQCDELFAISVLKWNPLSLTTLEEMVSSGVHSQLDDRELRALLFSMNSDMNYLDTYMQRVSFQQNVLMDLYPDLLPRGVNAKGEDFIQCNADGMRTNQAFINHLMSNIGRFEGLTRNLEKQLVSLQEIHMRLDEVLQASGSESNMLHQ